MTEAPTVTEILSVWTAEIRARRKYWIAGVPTRRDLAAAEKHVAHRLKITAEAVREAVNAVKPDPTPTALLIEGPLE